MSDGGCLGCGVLRFALEGVEATEPRPLLAVLREDGVDMLFVLLSMPNATRKVNFALKSRGSTRYYHATRETRKVVRGSNRHTMAWKGRLAGAGRLP